MALEQRFSSNDRKWLVKSGERVLGPYAEGEIKALLLSREIAPIDEVSAPGKRWRYLREEPSFARILEEVRRATDGRSETAGGQSSGTQTIAEDFAESTAIGFNINAVERAAVPGERKTRGPSLPPDALEMSGAYDGGGDAVVKASARRSTRLLWVVALSMLAAAGIAWLGSPVATFDLANPASPEARREGLEAFRIGRFDEALRKLADADAARPDDPEIAPKYAALLARTDQTQLAQRKVERLLSSRDTTVRRSALLAHAAALMADGDDNSASADLSEVLKLAPSDPLAAINAGVIAYRARDWKSASQRFRTGLQSVSLRAVASMMLARTLMQMGGRAAESEAVSVLTASIARTADYRQEAHLLLASIAQVRGEKADARLQAQSALAADPFATEAFRHDPELSLAPIAWASELLPICRSLSTNNSKESVMRYLLIICQQRASRTAEATAAATDAVQRSPDASMPQAISAYIALAQNQDATAQAALTVAADKARLSDDPLAVAYASRMRGHLCLRSKDWLCAVDAFAKSKNDSIPSIFYSEAVARSTQSSAPLESLRADSPNFIPLLELAKTTVNK